MQIERSIVISAPLQRVFDFVCDPLNDPAWCPKLRSVEQVTGDGPAPGAEYRVVHQPVPGRPARQMKYSLLAWDPPHRIQWSEDDGHDKIEVTYLLTEDAGGTRFAQRDDAELGASRLLQPLMRLGIGHDIAGQLKRLRSQLEAG